VVATDPPIEELLDEAMALHRAGEFGPAEERYRTILERQPGHPDASNLLGLIALAFGHAESAVELFEAAVDSVPDSGMFRGNLADALSSAGRIEEAEAAYRRAIELAPDRAAPVYNLGLLLHQLERPDEALASFRRAVALDPEHASARHLVAALSGDSRPDSAPVDYVTALFDDYAFGFEAHVTGELGYRVPDDLAAFFRTRELGGGWTVVDLGCGSGLAGERFRDLADHMVGCDLAGKMLAVCHGKGVYDQLWHEDAAATLARYSAVDLVIAADLFIYVGALETMLGQIAGSLRPGGYLAGSIEAADREFALRPSGRFAHAPDYLEAAAAAAGLTRVWLEPTVIRTEGETAIPGHLFVFRRA
jgi:predicted TPR repeat methyltransferase